MARKREVLPPPHLYCVTTLPSKTNISANIGVNLLSVKWTGTLHSQRHGVGRSISYGEDKGGLHRSWSESEQLILLQYRPWEGSAAWHQNNMSPLQVDTEAGWSASAHRPDHDGLSKKSTSTSLNLTCGLQIALILIPWITLFRVLFSNESTTNDNSRRWKNFSERYSHRVAKTLTAFHWYNSINEWRRRLEAIIKN